MLNLLRNTNNCYNYTSRVITPSLLSTTTTTTTSILSSKISTVNYSTESKKNLNSSSNNNDKKSINNNSNNNNNKKKKDKSQSSHLTDSGKIFKKRAVVSYHELHSKRDIIQPEIITKIKDITKDNIITEKTRSKKFKDALRYEVQSNAKLILFLMNCSGYEQHHIINQKQQQADQVEQQQQLEQQVKLDNIPFDRYIKLLYKYVVRMFGMLHVNNFVTPHNKLILYWLHQLETLIGYNNNNNSDDIGSGNGELFKEGSERSRQWLVDLSFIVKRIHFGTGTEWTELERSYRKDIKEYIDVERYQQWLNDNDSGDNVNIEQHINMVKGVTPYQEMNAADIKFCIKFLCSYERVEPAKIKGYKENDQLLITVTKSESTLYKERLTIQKDIKNKLSFDNKQNNKNKNRNKNDDDDNEDNDSNSSYINSSILSIDNYKNHIQYKHIDSLDVDAYVPINRFLDCEIGYSNATIQFLAKLVKAYPVESDIESMEVQQKVFIHMINMYTKIRLQYLCRRSFQISKEMLEKYMNLLMDIIVTWCRLSENQTLNYKSLAFYLAKIAEISSSINFRETSVTQQTEFLDMLLNQVLELHGHKQRLITEKQSLIRDLQREAETARQEESREYYTEISSAIDKLNDELQMLRDEQRELSQLSNIDFGVVSLSLKEIDILLSRVLIFKNILEDLQSRLNKQSDHYLLVTHQIGNISISLSQILHLREIEQQNEQQQQQNEQQTTTTNR
ncbi:hypothetical protein PPL_07710 [Heterostelium album PN500]|uniref:Uncharacterized protein n=1 Tax=Heterostelium pallidum (strain ATCC 26659 / Pp 5 / PN500) TaxID=670386 RepID=D3BGQ8_HETP5|nr:hypothetical protein PPL_07710 [Heterostelium album PN500]EFA79292.1 hypothetical protein PPL_07710 [Heterostelium album PN500]|eukprot:XP_020431413.1 hypothetical protein PPL_07710 [Heterostelium album PN500]